jgi:hypothetical protein
MRLSEVQQRVRAARQRSLRMAAAVDELHLDEARRQLGRLIETVQRDGWLAPHERQLAILTRDVTLAAARQMASSAAEHAEHELAPIDDEALRLARKARRIAVDESTITRLSEEMADRIDALLDVSDEPHVDLAAQSYQLARIVQTEAWRAYGQQRRALETDLALGGFGRTQRTAQRDGTLIVIAVEWDAWLDKRTCSPCAQHDGALRPLGMTFSGGIESPPLHPRCRCIAGYWPVPIPV